MALIHMNRQRAMINGYRVTLPRAGRRGIQRAAMFSAQTLSMVAQKKGITSFRGRFYANFKRQMKKPHKFSESSYGVSVATVRRGNVNYAVALDRMRPHWVKLHKGRIITKWAAAKLGIDALADVHTMNAILVRPHPYVDEAGAIIIKNVKRIIEGEMNKAIRRKGR